MSEAFMKAVTARRTYYNLSHSSPIPDTRIKEIVEQTLKYTPSSFNSQSTRFVLLLGEEHEKLWDIIDESYKQQLSKEKYEDLHPRFGGFRKGYGTVLFYEDCEVIRCMQGGMPRWHEKFPIWSEHAAAMHHYVLWTALDAEGLGCSLQHWNPVADARIQTEYDLPELWRQTGQLVFGAIAGEPGEKTFKPLEERMKVYGAKE